MNFARHLSFLAGLALLERLVGGKLKKVADCMMYSSAYKTRYNL